MDGIEALQEKLAHLMRAVDEMSDEMARQGREVDVLTRRVAMLLQREAQREAAEGEGLGAIPLADQKPPHW